MKSLLSLLQDKQSQLFFFHGKDNPILHSPLWPLKCVHVPLVLNTILQVWVQQHWINREDHLTWPAGNTLPEAAWDAICLLCSKGTFWLLLNLIFTRTPSPFPQSCFPAGCILAYTSAQGCSSSDAEISFSPFHEVPIEEPFGVHLDDSETLWHTSHSSDSSTVCKLAEYSLLHHPDHWWRYWRVLDPILTPRVDH